MSATSHACDDPSTLLANQRGVHDGKAEERTYDAAPDRVYSAAIKAIADLGTSRSTRGCRGVRGRART